MRPGPLPTGRRPRLVATGYGGSVAASFSGSGAYLAEAGIRDGSLDGAFTLWSDRVPDRGLQVRGAAWKARQRLRSESGAGFKFSAPFSAHLWRRHLPAVAGTDLVSTFQLYSDEFFDRRARYDVGAWFYLDGTLHDYLRGYRAFDVAAIDPATVDRAVEVERRGYARADGIAVMSRSAARTLVERYDVPAGRVHVVLPGANMDDGMVAAVRTARAGRPDGPFVVGFVGVYPERKGLPVLADAVARLRAEGLDVRLQVVGRCPPQIAAQDGVDDLGVIGKTTDPGAFAAAMGRVDLGCQLSTVELFGIAVLEFLRCGIPVLATEVGGIPDLLDGGGGIGVPADVTAEEVADALRRVVTDTGLRHRLETAAAARSEECRWEPAAAALGVLVAGR